MADWPAAIWEHGPTIHPWSREATGAVNFGFQDTLTSAASAAWPAANRAFFYPFGLTRSITAKLLWVYNGATVSGNFDIGIYDHAGVRLVSSGSTAQSGTGALQSVDITDTRLGPGLFYVALVFDNTTATVFSGTVASPARRRLQGTAQQSTAFPLPATATFAADATGRLWVCGLCTKTVI